MSWMGHLNVLCIFVRSVEKLFSTWSGSTWKNAGGVESIPAFFFLGYAVVAVLSCWRSKLQFGKCMRCSVVSVSSLFCALTVCVIALFAWAFQEVQAGTTWWGGAFGGITDARPSHNVCQPEYMFCMVCKPGQEDISIVLTWACACAELPFMA